MSTPDPMELSKRIDRAYEYGDEHDCWRTAQILVHEWRNGYSTWPVGDVPHAEAIKRILRGES